MQLNYRLDGRIEWVCEHGVGHTLYYPTGSEAVHGCCRCCGKSEEFKTLLEVVRHILKDVGVIKTKPDPSKQKELLEALNGII